MILQALDNYYQRKMADPNPARRLPAFGLERKAIPFIIELTKEGRLVVVKDTRTGEGRQKAAADYLVPIGLKRASGVAANLLWDNTEYVLGLPDAKKAEESASRGRGEAYRDRVAAMHSDFRARIERLPQPVRSDVGIAAVQSFLDLDPLSALAADALWTEIHSGNPLITFRLVGDPLLVCQRAAIVSATAGFGNTEDNGEILPLSTCLITGATAPPERLHSAIKGVWNAQTSGASIVSFNLDAFNSFGKLQGANAPVCGAAAFAYTTALNHLLAKGSRQRIQVGDTSTVFWAQKSEDVDIENVFAEIFGDTDDPDARGNQIRTLFQSIHTGRFDGSSGKNRFFVLGLAPNAARISVRFWYAAPLVEIAERIGAWFDDVVIARGPNDPEYPSLFRLLTAVAVQGKADNIPPRLGGDVMRSILSGTPFPAVWLNAAVLRCRAEQRVTYLRAAAIKSCLNRMLRATRATQDESESEITKMLDPSNPSAAYRLGRLFAVLEKVQEEASPGLNATIRERYYGAASSTPVAVFTTLLRLKNHHLAKLDNRGRAVNLEKLIGEIVDGIRTFPVQLALADQGRFALGYYHQRQAFFARPIPPAEAQPS
jgi:CRISPR-associated protein Csd1